MTYEINKNGVTLYHPDGSTEILAACDKLEIVDFKYQGHKELGYLQDGSWIISRICDYIPVITPIKKKGKKKDGS